MMTTERVGWTRQQQWYRLRLWLGWGERVSLLFAAAAVALPEVGCAEGCPGRMYERGSMRSI